MKVEKIIPPEATYNILGLNITEIALILLTLESYALLAPKMTLIRNELTSKIRAVLE